MAKRSIMILNNECRAADDPFKEQREVVAEVRPARG
jgi:hypothetical protein